jgi:hypothetical protein
MYLDVAARLGGNVNDEHRRWVTETRSRLRDDPGLGWRSLREFLKARGIDPARAALAVLYPDDVRGLVAVIVVSIDRMFEVDIDYPEGIGLAEAMEHGEIVDWRDDAAAIRNENQQFVDMALELLRSD